MFVVFIQHENKAKTCINLLLWAVVQCRRIIHKPDDEICGVVMKHIKKRFWKWYDNGIQFSSWKHLRESSTTSPHRWTLRINLQHELKYRLASSRLCVYNKDSFVAHLEWTNLSVPKEVHAVLDFFSLQFPLAPQPYLQQQKFKLKNLFRWRILFCLRCFPSQHAAIWNRRWKICNINLKEQCETLFTDSLLWFYTLRVRRVERIINLISIFPLFYWGRFSLMLLYISN